MIQARHLSSFCLTQNSFKVENWQAFLKNIVKQRPDCSCLGQKVKVQTSYRALIAWEENLEREFLWEIRACQNPYILVNVESDIHG